MELLLGLGIHVMTWMILYGAIARIGIPHVARAVVVIRFFIYFSKGRQSILSEEHFILRFVMILLANPNRCFKHLSEYLSPLHRT
jgi:hypothetical protein